MNDLDVLRDLRGNVSTSDGDGLRRARAELLRAAGTRSASRVRPRLAVAAGLAAVLVAGGLILYRVHSGPASTAPEAARLLRNAALTAAELPPLAARPDQFVYVESVTAWSMTIVHADGTVTQGTPVPTLRRIWLPVAGTRPGLLRERPRSGGAWNSTPLSGYQPPVYLVQLPTTADGMLAYLYRNSHGQNPRDVQAFITAGDLIREAYLPPAALAAVFEAVARIPGVTVVHGVHDAAGRPGVAVGLGGRRGRDELIFDAGTYRYLGERELAGGQVAGQAAQLRVAIVDSAGQVPS